MWPLDFSSRPWEMWTQRLTLVPEINLCRLLGASGLDLWPLGLCTRHLSPSWSFCNWPLSPWGLCTRPSSPFWGLWTRPLGLGASELNLWPLGLCTRPLSPFMGPPHSTFASFLGRLHSAVVSFLKPAERTFATLGPLNSSWLPWT